MFEASRLKSLGAFEMRSIVQGIWIGVLGTYLTKSAWLSVFVAHTMRLIVAFFLWKALASGGQLSDSQFVKNAAYSLYTVALWAVLDTKIIRFIDRDVRGGGFEYVILRPKLLFEIYLAQSVGRAIANLVALIVPFVAIIYLSLPDVGMLLFRLENLSILIMLLLLIVFFSAVDCLVGLTAFWTVSSFGLDLIKENVTRFLGGVLIPLSFYPPLIKDLAEMLPFRLFIAEPIKIVIGADDVKNSSELILYQLAVCALLLFLLWGFCRIARSHVSITGS